MRSASLACPELFWFNTSATKRGHKLERFFWISHQEICNKMIEKHSFLLFGPHLKLANAWLVFISLFSSKHSLVYLLNKRLKVTFIFDWVGSLFLCHILFIFISLLNIITIPQMHPKGWIKSWFQIFWAMVSSLCQRTTKCPCSFTICLLTIPLSSRGERWLRGARTSPESCMWIQ